MSFLRSLARSVLPKSVALALRKEYQIRMSLRGRTDEQREFALMHRLIKPGDTVWDIGANSGSFTVEMCKITGSAGRVYAFEPIPHNFDILKAVIAKGRLNNSFPMQVALGDRNGPVAFTMPAAPGFGAYFLARTAGSGDVASLTVEMTTADCVLASGIAHAPGFIKCDVEGTAGAVISGAVELIRQHHPIWLVECWYEQEIQLMRSLGYDIFDPSLNPVTGLMPQERNYVFIPKLASKMIADGLVLE